MIGLIEGPFDSPRLATGLQARYLEVFRFTAFQCEVLSISPLETMTEISDSQLHDQEIGNGGSRTNSIEGMIVFTAHT